MLEKVILGQWNIRWVTQCLTRRWMLTNTHKQQPAIRHWSWRQNDGVILRMGAVSAAPSRFALTKAPFLSRDFRWRIEDDRMKTPTSLPSCWMMLGAKYSDANTCKHMQTWCFQFGSSWYWWHTALATMGLIWVPNGSKEGTNRHYLSRGAEPSQATADIQMGPDPGKAPSTAPPRKPNWLQTTIACTSKITSRRECLKWILRNTDTTLSSSFHNLFHNFFHIFFTMFEPNFTMFVCWEILSKTRTSVLVKFLLQMVPHCDECSTSRRPEKGLPPAKRTGLRSKGSARSMDDPSFLFPGEISKLNTIQQYFTQRGHMINQCINS